VARTVPLSGSVRGRGRLAASADVALLVPTVLWAMTTPIVKIGITEISPLAFPLLRIGLSGVILLAIAFLREGSIRIARRDAGLFLGVALGIAAGQGFFVYSLANAPASDIGIVLATGPLVTALIATAVGFERLGGRHWIGTVTGLVGITLVVGGRVSAGGGTASLLGDLLALVSISVASGSAILIGMLLSRYSTWRILAWQMALGAPLLTPFALPGFASQDWGAVTSTGWAALAFTVVLSAVVANVIYFTAVGAVGPSRAALFQYLQSLLIVVFSVVLLGERLLLLQVIGGIVVIGSVMLSRSRPPEPGIRAIELAVAESVTPRETQAGKP
jgi:drug/metabolite transporter (DMT)-like permease